MTYAHVYNEIQKMKIIQVKTHKLYIIKKRSNNKVLFVEFVFNCRQFKLMTTGSQSHGARWPRFNCVQMTETVSSKTHTDFTSNQLGCRRGQQHVKNHVVIKCLLTD